MTVSGIDILDGTPVIDIKPYIPQYDCPTLRHDVDQGKVRTTQQLEQFSAGVDSKSTDDKAEDMNSEIVDFNNSTEDSNKKHGNNSNEILEHRNTSDKLACEPVDENLANNHKELVFDTIEVEDTKTGTKTHQKMPKANDKNECYSFKCLSEENIHVLSADKNKDAWDKLGCSESDKTSSLADLKHSVSESDIKDSLSTCGARSLQDLTEVKIKPNESKRSDKSSTEYGKVNFQSNTNSSPDRKARLFPNKCDDIHKLDSLSSDVTLAKWIQEPAVSCMKVRFTPAADEQLRYYCRENQSTESTGLTLNFVKTWSEAKQAITNILQEDPRSTYRRTHCQDSLYYFTFDTLHVTCWFDDNMVEVVRIKLVTEVKKLKDKIKV